MIKNTLVYLFEFFFSGGGISKLTLPNQPCVTKIDSFVKPMITFSPSVKDLHLIGALFHLKVMSGLL